jgi:hypothetical protein
VPNTTASPDTVAVNETLLDPSMLTLPDKSPPSVMVRAVCQADAVAALLVMVPVPLTFCANRPSFLLNDSVMNVL